MNKLFQPINPQGYPTEEYLYSELEAREIAKDGETLCQVSDKPWFNCPYPKDKLLVNTWVREEIVGKGRILFLRGE